MRASHLSCSLAVAALLVAAASDAAEKPAATKLCPAASGITVTVAEVIEEDSLKLADGRLLRLAGIESPRRGPWPIADAAKDALARLASGQTGLLALSAPQPDRYGRLHGDIVLAGGGRLATALVSTGFARVRVIPGEPVCAAGLLEATARAARRGLWDGPDYAIRAADDVSLVTRTGLYELVEGRVVSVGRGSSMVFLDFGRDYRRDFTVMLPAAVAEHLTVPAEKLAKRRIRVRGTIEENNGPAIRVDDPAEIEVLDEDEGAGKRG